jgi:nucleotide-binding universal stress UspA family protein
MEFRRILAPTDFSEFSKLAVTRAFELAQTFGATLTLVHVVEQPAYPVEGMIPPNLGDSVLEDLQQRAEFDLAQVLPEAAGAKVPIIRRVAKGIPYRQIAEIAAAEKVDLIVMATHGRTGLSHLFLGSVTERVVRTAPCPVLTLRASRGSVQERPTGPELASRQLATGL